MEKKLPTWKPIKMGDRLPCQSFLRKKDGKILKLSTGAGIKVGQDAYYLPVDDVIEEIRNYPIEESEDERIRKELLAWLKSRDGQTLPIDRYNAALSWLEKQGEQKPIVKTQMVYPKFRIGDVISPNVEDGKGDYTIVGFNKALADYLVDGGNIPSCSIGIEFIDANFHIKKQKPVEWSDEDEEIHRRCICAMRASACGFPEEEKFVEQVDNWLKSLKSRVKPQSKQEWSKEDEHYLSLCSQILRQYNTSTTINSEVLINWIKSLKHQPKNKWSEEDDSHIHNIIGFLEECKSYNPTPENTRVANFEINWLKSLKERCTWKPSDEQMEALLSTLPVVKGGGDKVQGILESLYQDLKKLKE